MLMIFLLSVASALRISLQSLVANIFIIFIFLQLWQEAIPLCSHAGDGDIQPSYFKASMGMQGAGLLTGWKRKDRADE